MSVGDDKAELRRASRRALGAMSDGERTGHSEAIVGRVLTSDAWRAAGAVLAYLALPSEVDLDAVFEAGIASGKAMAAPRADWAARSMVAALVEDVADVASTRTGSVVIREPRADAAVIEVPDLVLVPGLAFDAAGRRLGRGAGFYDRFLAGLPGGIPFVGVCFGCQVVDEVPAEAHDVRMTALVTEDGWRATP